MTILLNTAYFPPVQYFAAMAALGGHRVFVEACENYQKQSWRNRCLIYSASGPLPLSLPIVHDSRHSIPIREVRIDYSKPWLQQHRRAIVSAYRTSAFFEYYEDELFDILERRYDTLWEMNTGLTAFFLKKFGLPVEIVPTVDFAAPASASGDNDAPGDGVLAASGICPDGPFKDLPYIPGLDACDLRGVIHPKREDNILERLNIKKPYFQVFSVKHGFISGLSAMDLLFNEGPDSISYLRTSIRR